MKSELQESGPTSDSMKVSDQRGEGPARHHMSTEPTPPGPLINVRPKKNQNKVPFLLNALSGGSFDGRRSAPNAHKHQRWGLFLSVFVLTSLLLSCLCPKMSDPCDPNVLLFPSQSLSAPFSSLV